MRREQYSLQWNLMNVVKISYAEIYNSGHFQLEILKIKCKNFAICKTEHVQNIGPF